MAKSLQEFYANTDMKDNVHAYLVEFLQEMAVKELFENQAEDYDAYAISQAKRVIDKAFENLDNLFSPKAKKKEIINEAR